MSERGVFAVDRGIWSDPEFPAETFSEREAFIWLVGNAAWKPCRVRVGSVFVELERGQLAFSTRFMAAAWKWSEARVRRFLGRLADRETICTKTDARATQVTICNYDRFQRVSMPSDASATHERRKEEDRENTSLREEDSGKARKHAWPTDYREITWEAYGKKVERKPGIAALENLFRSDKVDWTEFIEGVRRQAMTVLDPHFRPSLARFIQREKWTDLLPQSEAPRGTGSSARVTQFAPRNRSAGTGGASVAAVLARRASELGIGPGGGSDHRGPDDERDHRPRRDDTEIVDAEYTTAPRYSAAH